MLSCAGLALLALLLGCVSKINAEVSIQKGGSRRPEIFKTLSMHKEWGWGLGWGVGVVANSVRAQLKNITSD